MLCIISHLLIVKLYPRNFKELQYLVCLCCTADLIDII